MSNKISIKSLFSFSTKDDIYVKLMKTMKTQRKVDVFSGDQTVCTVS